jgi:uncharacterized delta-60 repeat protein
VLLIRRVLCLLGLFVLALNCMGVAYGQVHAAWVRYYDGPISGDDYGRDLFVDANGNVYVTGHSEGNGTMSDYLTVKYDADGDTVWVRRLDGPGHLADEASAITVDASGNVYVTGGMYGTNPFGWFNYGTVKYNADGNTVWTHHYKPLNDYYDKAFAVEVDAAGHVYVTGSSTRYYATIKFDADGDTLWVRRYDTEGEDVGGVAYGLKVDPSGNVHIAGYADWDHLAVKYDASGGLVWARRYDTGGGTDDKAYGLDVDAAGNVYVTGHDGGYRCLTVKYNADGDTAWACTYPGNSGLAYAVQADADGNVYVAGASDGDYITIKYNADGDTLWTRHYDGPDGRGDNATDLHVDAAGNVYVTGYSQNADGSYDYATLMYNASGDQIWVRRDEGGYAYLPPDIPQPDLEVDANGNVYVAGYRYTDTTGYDYITIKYSPCACPYQSDFDEDGFITPLDLSAMIDILYAGAPDVQDPGCPSPRADFDCDDFSTALDLSGLIDHLFASGPGPCGPCAL